MSAVCLLKNFDGTMPRLEVLPDGERTRVLLHTRYWDREDRPVSADVEFSDVAAVRFSVNYLGSSAGSELFGLYELAGEEEKLRLLKENFAGRRRDFLLTGYDLQAEDPADLLNCTEPLERFDPADYHLYQQQTEGGVYQILAQTWRLKER